MDCCSRSAPCCFAAGSASGEGGGTADKVKLRAQLGIIYAQNGQYEEAKKEFVTLLEEPTGRAAALTNIGNLAVLDGKVDVGLENYNAGRRARHHRTAASCWISDWRSRWPAATRRR